tara:strand:- start:347 stop:676 length:330 start_codon:yes stop_codon:yes gene_type:complete
MENNHGSYESLKKQRPDITRSEYCRLRQQIRRDIIEESGLRAMARSQRRRENVIDGVKQEIIKQKENPKYRDNEGLRYLERQLDFGEKQQREYREFKDIKSFFEERMRQ